MRSCVVTREEMPDQNPGKYSCSGGKWQKRTYKRNRKKWEESKESVVPFYWEVRNVNTDKYGVNKKGSMFRRKIW